MVCFPLVLLEKTKRKRKFTFFLVNIENISSHLSKILENSLVLRTREFTDIVITFDEIYFCIPLKKVNILYIYQIRIQCKKSLTLAPPPPPPPPPPPKNYFKFGFIVKNSLTPSPSTPPPPPAFPQEIILVKKITNSSHPPLQKEPR